MIGPRTLLSKLLNSFERLNSAEFRSISHRNPFANFESLNQFERFSSRVFWTSTLVFVNRSTSSSDSECHVLWVSCADRHLLWQHQSHIPHTVSFLVFTARTTSIAITIMTRYPAWISWSLAHRWTMWNEWKDRYGTKRVFRRFCFHFPLFSHYMAQHGMASLEELLT